jgi:predicted RNase H-like HicB family nuclease/uncharacterized damage-inducible protein DinB
MKEYALYVESGPKRKKTQVHVLELLGCTAQGATTDEALQAVPEAIRIYLRFLQRCGEAANPDEPFGTTVAEHVMEGGWLGNGDPAPGFRPDFQPMSAEELGRGMRRLEQMQAELLVLVQDLSPQELAAEPEAGRSLERILGHVGESYYNYVHMIVGKIEGASAALKAFAAEPQGAKALPAALPPLFQAVNARLAALSEAERTQAAPHGQVTWTARRGLRRSLEHTWEHLQEVARRLNED